ncbi:hypothetical protein [Streptomyces sp. SID3343]|uniref:hypothetical protein n=1 Tax=Streptomyces sp. SID3343 TaxID=2690260 RepID=UPI0013702367|nr:hypothetical protein [Streptomyces sp. SID3343]MYW00904.1 hypothetical protein [Streptomyces sp. SID3343]
MPAPTPPRRRALVTATALCAALAGAAATAPPAAATTKTAQPTSAWLDTTRPSLPTIEVSGIYTCTDPVGTSLTLSVLVTQVMPFATATASVTLPCGPTVIDAPWTATGYADPSVHHGYAHVSVIGAGPPIGSANFDI